MNAHGLRRPALCAAAMLCVSLAAPAVAADLEAGRKVFEDVCAACHGPDLSGGEMAPGLTGGEFASNWNDLSVGDLYDRIRQSMPQNRSW